VLPLELQNLIDESERYIEQGALHHLDHLRRKTINEARVLPYLSSENRMVLGIPKQELCNPELMLQFWKWWLLEAIPKAYKLSADWD
jgi:hypothetical protein